MADFGSKQTIEMMWDANLPIIAVYRHILPARCIPDYGLHGVMRVCVCGIHGMRDSAVAATCKSRAVVARTLLQPILNVTRPAAKTCTRGIVHSKGANENGKFRLECAVPLHLMRNKGWETLVDECVHKGGVKGGRVAGQLRVDVCVKWWTLFSAICVFAWQTRWLTRGDLKGLRVYSIAMGEARLQLEWGKLFCFTCG